VQDKEDPKQKHHRPLGAADPVSAARCQLQWSSLSLLLFACAVMLSGCLLTVLPWLWHGSCTDWAVAPANLPPCLMLACLSQPAQA
jgi:hypothetical protein